MLPHGFWKYHKHPKSTKRPGKAKITRRFGKNWKLMAKSSNKVVENRRDKVIKMYLMGRTQSEIASELSVSESVISKDIKKRKDEWKEKRADSFDEKLNEELAKIDLLQKEAWDAWTRSKTNYKKRGVRVKGSTTNKTPDFQEITELEIVKDGNSRFLNIVMSCIDRRARLLGLDAPTKSIIEDHSFLGFLMKTYSQPGINNEQ